MSQPTFETAPANGAISPQSGAIGPQSGALTTSGALDNNQQLQADNLAAIESQQALAAQQQPQQPQKDKSKGWSLTNPFQDIGQVWHDVESHTVAPALKGANWLFTNLVKRPYTTIALYSAKNEYQNQITNGHANMSWWQGSQWAQAWDASAHISPGQATIVAAQDQQGVAHTFGVKIDPFDTNSGTQFATNNWGNKIISGSMDAAVDYYADPSVRLGSGVRALKGMAAGTIDRTASEADALTKLNAPRSVAFNNWAVNKDIASIAEHPVVKGTGTTVNPYRYQTAALIAGAKNPEEIGMIRQVMAGVPSAVAGLQVQAGNIAPVDKVLDKLAQTAPDSATQLSNLLFPMEQMEKAALTPASADELEEWLKRTSKTKTMGVQADINANSDRAQQILDLLSTQRVRTTTSAISNRLAEVRGNLKYANTRNTDAVSFMHNAFYNFPVRVYQGLTDRVEGLINHREDDAVEVARSWLNKSSTLTPDQKIDYLQRYAQAPVGDRQRIWDSVENDVYKSLGQRYGIDNQTMQKLLTTTRTKQGNFTRGAVSRAYGAAKIQSDEEHAILPTYDSEAILHPRYITQLEAGAVPMANLKNLENALGEMDRNGTLGTAIRAGTGVARDSIVNALDNVYGLWKPMALMTGHRAYNHIGDDWLRGLSKLGALTTIQNATEGAANFLRNTYARGTKNILMRNTASQHELAMGQAKANYEGLLAQYKTQRSLGINNIPELSRITPADLQAKKNIYNGLKNLKLDFIQPQHRLGTGTFKIAGSNIDWPEAFGGPNGDWARIWTSSHPTWNAMVDDAAHSTHSMMTAIRTRNFGTISATDDVAKHTRAYVHYVRNQMLPDPVAKQILQGRNLDDVANWLRGTQQGRNHIKALHIGDANDWVNTIAEDVKTHLPFDGMRDDALAGRFNADTIEYHMPDAAMRPDINANINTTLYGGDPTVNFLKHHMETIMKWTGTLPDDIMVRHPVFNSLYKNRLSDNVQSWMSQTGQRTIDQATRDLLIKNSMTGARKDMQSFLYDVSRFNDLGHTLRFVSPFFNAWFNAMSSWSKLFMENPTLLGRSYQAKRLLWDSPFAIDNTTGQKATVDTPWENTSFVAHLPKGLADKLGGFNNVPIDAKTLISPTYLDSIGNPGFGPLVSVAANRIVQDHPTLMNDAIVRAMLNNMVDKNSMNQILPSGARDVTALVQLLSSTPDASSNYAKNVWSIYQEQYYDYLNGQRTAAPNWSDVENQAKFLTVVDLVANRVLPLGFKPSQNHQFLIDEFKKMQIADPRNARQNFYDKYGQSGMMFTQSLNTDPSGIPATIGAAVAVKKYSSILKQYPELGSVVIGPEGNGNFDQMAYDWEVAHGLRQKLTPQQAASQAQINTGWAEYGKVHSAILAQVQARGLTSINDIGARDLKQQLNTWVGTMGDPNSNNYNPDFYANYTSFNQNAYQNRIVSLLKIAQDPALLSNPLRSDIRSLQAYSQLRDTIFARLQKSTSTSLKAAVNTQIAQDYDDAVSTLILHDTKFAQIYQRYLAKDDWKEPV